MPDPRERLAVLEDRLRSGTVQEGDLPEALALAREALDNGKRNAEVWATLQRVAEVVEPLEARAAAEAAFLRALSTPKVLAPVGVAIALVFGAVFGAVEFAPISVESVLP